MRLPGLLLGGLRLPVAGARVPDAGEMPDVEALAAQGKTIDARKAYRARSGAGFAEAKAAVDAIARRTGR